MPAQRKTQPPKRHARPLVQKASSPMFLILMAFLVGFCTHILINVIFAENKSDGVIHACIKKNGEVRIITDYKEYKEGKRDKERRDNKEDVNGCRDNESVLTWNVQGPQGPPGTSGGSGGGSSLPFICTECSLSDYIGDRLQGKDLSNSVLARSNLQNVTLKSTNFSNANLSFVDFSHGDLSDVNFENANLSGANLEGTTISNIKWKNTVCPDNSNSDANNSTCDGHLQASE